MGNLVILRWILLLHFHLKVLGFATNRIGTCAILKLKVKNKFQICFATFLQKPQGKQNLFGHHLKAENVLIFRHLESLLVTNQWIDL